MTSKGVQWFLIFLIFTYTILIFATIALSDLVSDKDLEDSILEKFAIAELVILLIFTVEIFLSSYS